MSVFVGVVTCALAPISSKPMLSRRYFSSAGVLALLAPNPVRAEQHGATWGPFAGKSEAEIEALNEASLDPTAEYVLPNGVRVIDLIKGTGPEPSVGDRVYLTYKVWAFGFRVGTVADWSYMDGRPYDYILGLPTERIPPGVDEGIRGMREGGWRRLVVPSAYPRGLKRVNPVRGGGRTAPPKAGLLIQPGAFAFFDVIMVDGGSDRCDAVLKPRGLPEAQAQKLRSLSCVPGEVSDNFNIATGIMYRK